MTSRRVRRLQSVVGSAALAVPLTVASVAPAGAAAPRHHPRPPAAGVSSVALLRRVVSTLDPGDSVRITWTDAAGRTHAATVTA